MTNTPVMLKNTAANMDYLLCQRYALVHPIYTSTYEKEDELKSDYPDKSERYTEHVIAWGKEYKKTLDYIETREDFDMASLSYYGVSWGGYMANILLAIDDRVTSAVLNVAGLCFQAADPSVEAYIYTPRVKCPVLMLNGKYDVFSRLRPRRIPCLFLGTPMTKKALRLSIRPLRAKAEVD